MRTVNHDNLMFPTFQQTCFSTHTPKLLAGLHRRHLCLHFRRCLLRREIFGLCSLCSLCSLCGRGGRGCRSCRGVCAADAAQDGGHVAPLPLQRLLGAAGGLEVAPGDASAQGPWNGRLLIRRPCGRRTLGQSAFPSCLSTSGCKSRGQGSALFAAATCCAC